MGKTTKRSKKFIIATSKSKKGAIEKRKGGGGGGGGASRAPNTKTTTTTTTTTAATTTNKKKGGGGKKRTAGGGGGGGKGRGKSDFDAKTRKGNVNVVDREEEEEDDDGGTKRRREDDDFVNDARLLGRLDVDSFFERAVGGLAEAAGGRDEDEDEDDDDDDAEVEGEEDEDDDDSFASLGSEEEDVKASEARLRRQLDELSSKDPEFYGYLKDNESSLLEYDDDDDYDEAEEDDDEDDDDGVAVDDLDIGDDAPAEKKKKSTKEKIGRGAVESKFLLTPRRLEQLERGAFDRHSRSLKGLKRIVSAYGTACRLSDANRQDRDDDDDDDEVEGGEDMDVIGEEDTPSAERKKKESTKEEKIRRRRDDDGGRESKFLLTPRRLEQLERGAFDRHSRSLRGLKRIVSAYGTACRLSDANRQDRDDDDDDDENDDGSGGGGGGGGEGVMGGRKRRRREFRITSPAVFDRLVAVCLVRCHEEFRRHLLTGEGADDDVDDDADEDSDDGGGGGNDDEGGGAKDETKEEEEVNEKIALDENRPIHPRTLAKSPNWPILRPVIESFLKSTLHVLSESGKEAELLRFVLSCLARYVPYLTAYPRLARPTLRTCVRLWSATLDASEGHNAVRLTAFLRIRQLAITQPYPLIEDCLKSAYLGYARRSKFGTASNVSSVLPTLTFMGNCVVELYALDYASAYQHAFVYIRQLALHLRSAMIKKTPESRAAVCCWQYVHCLKLWVAVLCAACGGNGSAGVVAGEGGGTSKLGGGPGGKDEEANLLRSLVYPLTEVILGTCRLVPVAQFVPLRLHCVRLLQQLAASTGTFVPTTSLLLGVLDLREVGMKPLRGDGAKRGGGKNKSGTAVRGLRLPLILKLPKEGTLRTMEQLDGVLKEAFVLLNREVDLYRYSPGFPEFTFSILQRLRKFNKEIGNGQWRAYSKGTIELCEKYSAFAIAGRSTLVDAPKDVRRLEALKPSNVPGMRDRYESAVAKERRLEVVTRPAMKANDKKVLGYDDDDIVKDTPDKRKRKGGEEDGDSDEEEKKVMQKSKMPKKTRKAVVVNEADLNNVSALKEEDEVQEGIVWSDSEYD